MRVSDDLLQKYLDGELSATKARRLAAQIAGDLTLQRRVQLLRDQSAALRDVAARWAAQADFSDLWSKVEQRAAQSAPAPKRSISARWLAFAGGALAAGVAIVALILSLNASPSADNDCVIETIEVGSGAVSTIFTIDATAQAAAPTTVIWIDEHAGEE